MFLLIFLFLVFTSLTITNAYEVPAIVKLHYHQDLCRCYSPNETWVECSNQNEPKCGDPYPPKDVRQECGPPKCQCSGGYFRDGRTGRCILRDDCCPNAYEKYNLCSIACEPSCQTPEPKCPNTCGPPKCQCQPGYFRDPKGRCIEKENCPYCPPTTLTPTVPSTSTQTDTIPSTIVTTPNIQSTISTVSESTSTSETTTALVYPAETTTTESTTSTTTKVPTTTCNASARATPMDLCILLDGSTSIGLSTFNTNVLKFTKKLARTLNASRDGNHVAVVQFSNEPKLELGFDKGQDPKKIDQQISKIKYLWGGTNTGKALDFTRKSVFNVTRFEVDKFLIIMTDGLAKDATEAPAKALRDEGVKIMAIGVGKDINKKQLEQMTGDPLNVYTVDNFSKLDVKLIKNITNKACATRT